MNRYSLCLDRFESAFGCQFESKTNPAPDLPHLHLLAVKQPFCILVLLDITRKLPRNGLIVGLRNYLLVHPALRVETDPFKKVLGPTLAANNRSKAKTKMIIVPRGLAATTFNIYRIVRFFSILVVRAPAVAGRRPAETGIRTTDSTELAQSCTLCYAILLPAGKSGFRPGLWPDSSRESLKIGPGRPKVGRRAEF